MIHENILAKGKPLYTTLYQHLSDVSHIAQKFANYSNIDIDIAKKIAILHDIGKASTVFQNRISDNFVYTINDVVYRHELGSLFFISFFEENIRDILIEGVVGHHKSVLDDHRSKGFMDLVFEYGFDYVLNAHIVDFDNWKIYAINILKEFNIKTYDISIEEAKDNFRYSYNILLNKLVTEKKYSSYKGILVGSDYLASAIPFNVENYSKNLFKKPNLKFYDTMVSSKYPLSLKDVDNTAKHTIVIACTGAGKTNYLLRRCRGRVYYVLPYTASINSMYNRIKNDIAEDNTDLDIRVQHSTSNIVVKNENYFVKNIQSHVGSHIKILTPHQILGIVFGVNGYEAIMMDLKGCDIILDEIHTYSEELQGAVLKMVEILNNIGCRIHIGTATIPTILYDKIINILGVDNVYEVSLTDKELETYNRHIIHKHNDWDSKIFNIIFETLKRNEKVLLIRNTIREAQELYRMIDENIEQFYNCEVVLLHSRFKRGRRNELERELTRLNKTDKPCIVVSTQVVEVSLDISFDLMVTDNAPIDSLIQRFGRINRVRKTESDREYKPIYIINHEKRESVLPYKRDVLNKTFGVLPDGKILDERNIQKYIDFVYSEIDFKKIDKSSIFSKGKFTLKNLVNKNKSVIFDLLSIEGGVGILDTEYEDYINEKTSENKLMYEIPCNYRTMKSKGFITRKINKREVFIIPKEYYTNEIGLDLEINLNNIL